MVNLKEKLDGKTYYQTYHKVFLQVCKPVIREVNWQVRYQLIGKVYQRVLIITRDKLDEKL